MRYTVLRNGVPLPACTGITATQCDNSGIAYDGTVYQYSVSGDQQERRGRTTAGPARQLERRRRAAPWGALDVSPTGQNAEATATFDVPASRGATSHVRIFVDGAPAKELDGRGPQDPDLRSAEQRRAPRGDPRGVQREACLRDARRAQNVQTYGPLTNAHVHRRCSPTSTAPGSAGRSPSTPTATRRRCGCAATSATRASRPTGVDVSTFTTSTIDIGYSTTETVTVTLSDTSPNRGTGTRTGVVRTEDPPPPEVSVSRGGKCNDNGGHALLPRRRRRQSPCTPTRRAASSPSPPALHQRLDDLPDLTTIVSGHWATKTVSTNRSDYDHAPYFGYPAALDLGGRAARRLRRHLATTGPTTSPPTGRHHVTLSHEQAAWFKQTFDQLTDNMEKAVLGKRHVVRLALTCLLSEGHLLLEDFPGTGKTMLARALANTVQGSARADPVHPRPAAVRRHRRDRLRPAQGHLRVPPGPDLPHDRARRRDQPGLAQDPVGAARGDGGGPGHRRRRRRTRSAARSW